MRKFFYAQGMKAKTEQRIESIIEAMPLSEDEVTVRCLSRRAVALCETLQMLSTQIRRYESELKTLVPRHPDFAIVAVLPGASTYTVRHDRGVGRRSISLSNRRVLAGGNRHRASDDSKWQDKTRPLSLGLSQVRQTDVP